MSTSPNPHLFDSSNACIRRAAHHAADFEQRVNEFINSDAYAFVEEVDPNTLDNLIKFKLVKPLPSDWPSIVFDIIGNLRAALDQIVFAFKPADTVGSFYPFSSAATNYESAIKGRCKDVPDEIVDVIRMSKAYKGGNNILWTLHALANPNKHATLTVVGTVVGSIVMEKQIAYGQDVIIPARFWDSEKNEMILARIRKGGFYRATNPKVALTITLSGVEFINGKPAVGVLNELVKMVDAVSKAIQLKAADLGWIPPLF